MLARDDRLRGEECRHRYVVRGLHEGFHSVREAHGEEFASADGDR